jgi:translocation protein SEC63
MNKYGGATGGVLKETQYYFHTERKPHLGVMKAARVLSVASEYVQIPVKQQHDEPVKKLLNALRGEVDAKDPRFVKRHPAIIKAHALLLAQASRKTHEVSETLRPDLKQVMKLFPTLFAEAVNVFLAPVNQTGYAYAKPVLSLLEFSQCVTQAVAPSTRRDDGSADAGKDNAVSLLQLPHVDEKPAGLWAKKGGVRSIGDLAQVPGPHKRAEALLAAGLSKMQVADVEAHLVFVPRADILEGTIETDGEQMIVEQDMVTCTLNVKISRGGAGAEVFAIAENELTSSAGEKPKEKPARLPLVGGAVVRSAADLPPLPFCEHCDREEGWWIAIVDHAANFILSHRKLDAKGTALRVSQILTHCLPIVRP